jgi:hypothetical protein
MTLADPQAVLGPAIVLVAGDKAGRWRTWYAEAIPLAGERYAAYQQEAEEEEEE